jgi:hypothetical protein
MNAAELILYCGELSVQVKQAVVVSWDCINVSVNEDLF